MLNDYGRELVNVLDSVDDLGRTYARLFNSYGLPIGAIIDSLLRTTGTILYFPPGNYLLEARGDRAPYICAPGVQLFFATGALLRLADGVTFVIQGTIRAGSHQIFGFNSTIRILRRRDEPDYALPPTLATWPTGEGAGRVVIDSDAIPQVCPEWWGARVANVDCSDAFQGAFDAACTGRPGRSPIPIVLLGAYDCGRVLEVRAPLDDDGKVRPVCLVLRGGVGLGETASLRRTRSAAAPLQGFEVALRLHPGVDFDFRDLHLRCVDDLHGCLDVLCSPAETALRRGFLQRVTLLGGLEFQLRIAESGRSQTPRHFVLDSCALLPVPNIPARNALRLDAGPSVMLRVSNTGMVAAGIVEPALELPPRGQEQATCLLIGGSVLLDSLMFHDALGPRPSREPVKLDDPDGQDIFVGAPTQTERPATQLTVIHCESQSWWFLGRDARAVRSHQAVLLGVAHNPVVWHIGGNRLRRQMWYTAWQRMHGGLPLAETPGNPPSVVWRGVNGQCVLIGCRLGDSVVLTDPSAVIDVATVFGSTTHGDSRKLFRYPTQMISLATGYNPVNIVGATTLDGNVLRLVPILEDMMPESGP